MKFNKVSLAALALLGYVDALNIKSYQGLGDKIEADSNIEAHRYINSRGEPINLSETQGHARIELTQARKYKHDDSLLQTEDDEKKCTNEDLQGVGHCPTNKNGP